MQAVLTKPNKRTVATIPQLSALLHQHPKTLYDLAARQALPVKTFRSGRRIFAARHDLEQLLGVAAVAEVLDRDEAPAAPAIAS